LRSFLARLDRWKVGTCVCRAFLYIAALNENLFHLTAYCFEKKNRLQVFYEIWKRYFILPNRIKTNYFKAKLTYPYLCPILPGLLFQPLTAKQPSKNG
jgi:hypothetical protein